MNAARQAFELRVVEGTSHRNEVVLEPGMPCTPFGIGTRASWRVEAQGVAPEHVYVAFNGSRVFVCSARGQSATLDGTPLGVQWTEASVPNDLRFGGARVRILPRAGHEDETAIPEEEVTRVPDFARAAVSRAHIPAGIQQTLGMEDVTYVLGEADGVACPVSSTLVPEAPLALAVAPIEPRFALPNPPALGRPTTAPLPCVPSLAPAQMARPLTRDTAFGRGALSVSMPPTVPSEGIAALASGPTSGVRREVNAYGIGAEPTVFSRRRVPSSTVDSIQGVERGPALSHVAPLTIPVGALPPVRGNPSPAALWNRLSLAQKAIAVLLLPTVIVGAWTVHASGRGVVRGGAASSGLIRGASESAGRVTPRNAAVPAQEAVAVPHVDAARGVAAIDERQALDKAVAGLDSEAVEVYERLAEAYPDRPVFREAARVLRARAAAHE